MKKQSKGITLVALVVTIIILLILAGITINTLTKNGLFEKAKEARDKWQNAQNEEEMEIAKYSNEIDHRINGIRNNTTINFSKSEQNTGVKWIDGKYIYSQVMDLGTSYSISANSFTNASEEMIPNNMDFPIKAAFYIFDSTNNWKEYLPCTFRYYNNKWQYYCNDGWTAKNIYLYIEYTKTTN